MTSSTKFSDSIFHALSDIGATAKTPASKARQIEDLYLSAPPSNRKFIAQRIFDTLFFIAYVHPDNSILDFFKQQGNSNNDYPVTKLYALFNAVSYFLYINQQSDSGMLYLEKAKKYESQFNDTLYKSYYTLYAQALMQKENYREAADYYLKTIAIAEKLKDSAAIIGNYGNLSVVYSQMDNYERALPIEKKCLDYYSAHGNNAYAFIGNTSIARTYYNMDNTDSAFYYYSKALALHDSGVNNPSVEIILYTNLGEIYSIKGDLKKAVYYFDLCKAPLQMMGSNEQQMIFTIYSSYAYAAKYQDASRNIKALQNAIDTFTQQNNLMYVRDGYFNLYSIAQMQHRPEDAMKYYRQFDSTGKILSSEHNNRYIAELQTKYETQKKETQIQLQQKELQRKSLFNQMLLVLLLAIVTGTAFIVTRERLKRKRKEAEQQQRFTNQLLARGEAERSRVARDLHDGLSQELLLLKNQVSSGGNIQPEKIDNIINEVRTISHNIHPVMLDQIGLKESILHICEQLMNTEQLFISTDIQYHNELSKEKELQLFRIIQEALNNIVKYASAHAAKIHICKNENIFITSIQDNGKGFDVAEALRGKSSFGLQSIIERSKSMNGKALILSDNGGTIIKIEIPL
ncbi:hypothetical protein A9P82_02585 [Arachidicoccus ginsenosidimutans]|nr:hypothetical protein A9P82_02585 [Arachidicoccus sp. BS20]